MVYEMTETDLENFSFRYDFGAVKDLNRVFGWGNFNKIDLISIGEYVSRNIGFLYSPVTVGSPWFGGLKFGIEEGAKVVVLLPWKQDLISPDPKTKRSVNVRSDRELPTKTIGNLLETITKEMLLRIPLRMIRPALKE